MKRTYFYLIIILAAVFLFASSSTGQIQKLSTPTKKVKTKRGIVFEKSPRPSPSQNNRSRLSERQGVARPAPLSPNMRAGLIREARTAAGMSAAVILKSLASPPVQIILTPDAPMRNRCDFSVWTGSHYPSGKGAIITKDCPYAVGHAGRSGKFFLNFWTRPGKSYFLDIAVSPGGEWYFVGGVNAKITAVNGHLIVGFQANSSATEIEFYKPRGSCGSFYFYRAELTQID